MIVKIPNAVTARTLRKADRGEDLTRSKNAADLFGKLGIWTTPVITEVCVGMEVTSYLSAET